MRAENTLFPGNTQGGHPEVDRGCQRCKPGARFYSDPENPRGPGRRKKSIAAKMNLGSCRRNSIEGLLDRFNLPVSLFPNKLQSDVQGTFVYPARVRREAAHCLDKPADPLTNAIVDVEGNKKP